MNQQKINKNNFFDEIQTINWKDKFFNIGSEN